MSSSSCLPFLLLGGPLTTALYVRFVMSTMQFLNLRKKTDSLARGTIFHFGHQAMHSRHISTSLSPETLVSATQSHGGRPANGWPEK